MRATIDSELPCLLVAMRRRSGRHECTELVSATACQAAFGHCVNAATIVIRNSPSRTPGTHEATMMRAAGMAGSGRDQLVHAEEGICIHPHAARVPPRRASKILELGNRIFVGVLGADCLA